MAQLPSAFHSADHADMNDFKPVPAGDYIAQVVESAMKPTKANDGSAYLELTFEILHGEYKGKKFWDRLNLRNKSKQAVEIANNALATLCRAVGLANIDDSQPLHGKPLTVTLKVDKATANNPESNSVGFYAPMNAVNPNDTDSSASTGFDDDEESTSEEPPTEAKPEPQQDLKTAPFAEDESTPEDPPTTPEIQQDNSPAGDFDD